MPDENKAGDGQQDQQQATDFKVFDKEGNEIVGVLPPEKITEMETQLKQSQEELAKLQKKDFNFENYRKLGEKEKAQMVEKFSEEQKILLNTVDSLQGRIEGSEKTKLDEVREKTLSQLAGSDVELRKQIEEQMKEFGEAKTIEEVVRKATNSYTLVVGMKPTVNPLHQFAPSGGYTPPSSTKYVNTTEGKEAYKKMFGYYPGENKKQSNQ